MLGFPLIIRRSSEQWLHKTGIRKNLKELLSKIAETRLTPKQIVNQAAIIQQRGLKHSKSFEELFKRSDEIKNEIEAETRDCAKHTSKICYPTIKTALFRFTERFRFLRYENNQSLVSFRSWQSWDKHEASLQAQVMSTMVRLVLCLYQFLARNVHN